MTGEVLALLLTLLAHVVGGLVLIASIVRSSGADWRSLWPRDDDGGGSDGPPAPAPRPAAPGGGGLPLPDAAQPAHRLRERERLAGAYPRPSRRPEHPPLPAPARPREPTR